MGSHLCARGIPRLLAWAIFTAYMTVASLRTTGAAAAVFVALTLTFVLLTIGAVATGTTATDWTKVGGWVGLATVALAWCACFAERDLQANRAAHVPTQLKLNRPGRLMPGYARACGYHPAHPR